MQSGDEPQTRVGDIKKEWYVMLWARGKCFQLFQAGAGVPRRIYRSAGIDRVRSQGVSVRNTQRRNSSNSKFEFKGNNSVWNNHDNTFTETARAAGVLGPGRGFATWFFDYDNDGWSDLFATSYFTSVDESVRTYLNLPPNAAGLKLYKNLGDGTFRDVTSEVGLDKVFMPMGANFGDVDNDGFLDIRLGTEIRRTHHSPCAPSQQGEGKSFVDVTHPRTGELHKGHGIAFADLDNDGDEEIVAEIGGATPGDSHPLRLFENPGHGNDWINLRLVGVKTNRAAIGARIELTVENEGRGTRAIYRSVGSGGSFGASPWQHIGLGRSARLLISRSGGRAATPASVWRLGKISPSRH